MPVSKSGFMQGLAIAILASVVVGGLVYRYVLHPNPHKDDAPGLRAQALEALEAVSKRDLTKTLRPARYDAILGPLDKLLREAKRITDSDAYDPVADYEKLQSYLDPVIEVAPLANALAQRETTFLKKDYRFMEQKGEACQRLAAALWNRLATLHARNAKTPEAADAPFMPSATESERLYSILEDGLRADPNNKHLWYLRALVERVNGSFAAAEADLRKTLELDANYIPALNDLGLALVNLKRFDEAEQAFKQAVDRAADVDRRAEIKSSPAYTTALFNLAYFHEAMAARLRQTVADDPTVDNRALLKRHADRARVLLNEFIQLMPTDAPEALEARKMIAELPS